MRFFKKYLEIRIKEDLDREIKQGIRVAMISLSSSFFLNYIK